MPIGTTAYSSGIGTTATWAALAARRARAAAAAAAARKAAAKKTPNGAMAPAPPGAGPWAAMSEEEINRLADERAQAQYAALEDPIKRAQEAARLRALGASRAEIGFTGAAQGALSQVGPGLQSAYADAAQKQGNLGDVSPEVGGFTGADVQAIGGTGQAAGGWGEMLGQIQGNLGQENLASLIAQGEQEQKDYEQQLIDLAHQKPELRAQVVDQLHQYELQKLQARQTIREMSDTHDKTLLDEADRRTQATGTLWIARNGHLVNTGKPTIAGRAESTNEAALGVKAHNDQLDYNAAVAKLNAQQQTAIAKAEEAGTQIDAQASKGAGYMVDQHGRPVLDSNGKRIPYKSTGGTSAKGTPYQKAVGEAKSMIGKPNPYTGKRTIDVVSTDAQGNSTYKGTITIKGKYLAAPDAKGVFSVPDQYGPGGQPTHYIRTTNDPRKAAKQTQMTFDQALNYLISRYGITPAKAKAALRAAGWRP